MIDENTGAAGLFGPPDAPFPHNDILAAGVEDPSGWVLGDADPARIAATRRQRSVAPLRHRLEVRQRAEVAAGRPLTPNRP